MIRKLAKILFNCTPFWPVRRDMLNRFQATELAIRHAAQRGYRPDVVVDAGANVGQFAAFALDLFPNADVHSVEPQPGCRAKLEALSARYSGRMKVHGVAVAAPQHAGSMLNLAATADSTSTGAHVVPFTHSPNGLQVPCVTLDSLIEDCLEGGLEVMLKLDLQGYEMEALRGAKRLLQNTGLVLCEASLFAQAYEPSVAVLFEFFDQEGFELYDIASLSARRRDNRAKQADLVFARRGSALVADTSWS